MAEKVALVAGVGRGTGGAVARRFAAGGYRVALVARSAARLEELEAELPGSLALPCDLTDQAALEETLARCRAELGEPDVVVHNAARGVWGSFLDIDPAEMEANFRVNTMSLLYLARAVAPAMVKRGAGAIIVTGNTSAWRGKPRFSMFAPTKAAQRILAQAMARDLGPQGIHVAYVTVDAAIDTPWTRPRIYPDKPDDFFCKPSAIADEVFHVAHQDRSAWSFDVELRPHHENW